MIDSRYSIYIFALQRSRQGAKGVLISGYNLLQRMALGLEVVLRNLQNSPVDYATKNGNFWHLAYQQANRAIESTYLLLKNQNFPVENLPLLPRNTVPLNVACISSQAISDMRDWTILHDSITVTDFYVKMFNSYKDHMAHRLVERAAYDISSGQTKYLTVVEVKSKYQSLFYSKFNIVMFSDPG